MRHFIVAVLLGALFLMASCKKDEGETPSLDISALKGTWKHASTTYEFSTKGVCPELMPSFTDSLEFNAGSTLHEFNENNPVPLLPDFRFREKGDLIIQYAWHPNQSTDLRIVGYIKWRDKWLLAAGQETSIGEVAPRQEISILIPESTPDQIEINGTTYQK